jgi:hypothetical protein
MAENVTAEEIAQLVEFCRNERDAREFSRVENDYVTTARSALAIAEKLPALLAERETLEKERDEWRALYSRDLDPPVCRLQVPDGWVPGNAREAAEGWHAAYEQASADRDALKKERDDAVTLGWKAAHDAVLSMQANWHQDCRSDEQRNALMEVATSIADELRHMSPGDYLDVKWKDAQNAIASERRAEFAESERDRLAAEVERLKRLCSGGAYDTLQSEQAWKRRAESAERESTAANAALQKIGMSLGSSDEWTDQATMIADVDGRVAAARETIAKLQFDIARISEYAASSIEFDITRDDLCKRITVIADAALAQLDAAPADEVPACHPYASPWGLDAAPEAETIDLPGVTSADVALRAHMRATFEKLSAAQEPLGAEFANLLNDHAVDLASDDLTADQIVIRNLEARVGEAERAVAEAVEIMLPFAEIAANEIRVDENDATKLPVRIGHVRAARAFVEKHGGAK